MLDVCSNVGGCAAAAVKSGCMYIAMEDDKRMRDVTLDYVTTILATEAEDCDYFEEYCAGNYETGALFLKFTDIIIQ